MYPLSRAIPAAITVLAVILSCATPKTSRPLGTVDSVDLTKYAGTWYEIARLPNSFEKGLICVSATYTLRDDGKITVLNRGVKEEDRSSAKTAKGIARVPDPAYPGRLEVSFFRPFYGDYWIMDLDSREYGYVLVGVPSREYLWILARSRSISRETYDRLVQKAKDQGFATDSLLLVDQNCAETAP